MHFDNIILLHKNVCDVKLIKIIFISTSIFNSIKKNMDFGKILKEACQHFNDDYYWNKERNWINFYFKWLLKSIFYLW